MLLVVYSNQRVPGSPFLSASNSLNFVRIINTREVSVKSCFPLKNGDKIFQVYPFLKGVHSKKEEFAPKGSKFFPFRVDQFSEGRKTILTVVSLESVSIPLR